MHPTKDESVDDGSEQKLNSSTSSENTKRSVPELMGKHGPWQYRHWMTFFLASACNSFYLFSIFPLTSNPQCTCRNASETDLSFETNCSTSQCISEAVPEIEKSLTESCGKYLEVNFISDQDTNDCSNINIIMYAKCIYVAGILLSGLTIHPLMFKFGRRAISLTSSLILFASALAISWAQTASTFLILRFIVSVGIVNIYILSAFSLVEVTGEEYRLVYGLIGHLGWGFAHFLLPLAGWLAQNWIQYSITLSTIPLLLCIALYFIPESVEAFLSKGLWTRAHKIIRKAACYNGYATQDIEQFAHNFNPQKEQEELRTLISKTEQCQKYFQYILLFFVGFSASFLYFTSIWLTEWVKTSRGTYFALAGTTEIASVIILLSLTCFLSLKHIWSVTTVAASVSLLIMYAKQTDDSKVFSTFPYLFTMFFASAAWTILLYRTLFRPIDTPQAKWSTFTTCVAVCAGILAAAATDFQKFYTWNPKLFVIYGIPNLTVGASIGFMPDRYFRF